MQHIVILTGAGISAESGLKTFRDSDGLWEGHDIMEVFFLEGWKIFLNFIEQWTFYSKCLGLIFLFY